MKISIQPSALADLRVGFRFYEKQQAGLGGYFIDSLYSDIDSLLLYAGIHSQHFGKYRLLSDRFPFASPIIPQKPPLHNAAQRLSSTSRWT